MSKTIRKRAESFVAYFGFHSTLWDTENKLWKKADHFWKKPDEWVSYRKEEAMYDTDNCGQGWFRRTKPKHYRNLINRKRRRRDDHELWKEVNIDGYEGLYSSWNCKDSDPSWYW